MGNNPIVKGRGDNTVNNRFFVLVAVLVMVLALPFVGSAQESTPEPEATSDALSASCWEHEAWLDTPQLFRTGAEVNLRGDSTTRGVAYGSVPAGAFFQAFAAEEATDGLWLMGRWWNDSAHGFGWVRTDVAQLVEVTDDPLPEWTAPDPIIVDTGVQVDIMRIHIGDWWVLDVLNLGDVFLVEGRQELTEEHHIWSLRGRNGVENTVDTRNDLFCFAEGSGWAYDVRWNADELGNSAEPALAEMLANDKRTNMQNNVAGPYDWPIFIHRNSGEVYDYAAGVFVESALGADESDCAFDVPRRLYEEITGVYSSATGMMVSSIGATNCQVIVIGDFDGDVNVEVEAWRGSRDNFSSRWVFAYMLPETWSEQQMLGYIPILLDEIAFSAGTVIENESQEFGIAGFPSTFVVE